MTIETKYDIGDWVWFMCENKALQSCIEDIRAKCEKNGKINVHYWIRSLNFIKQADWLYSEKNLFPTKEELLKSL